jgi:RES domain-containing protein
LTALREASCLRAPIKPITLVSYRVTSTAIADLTVKKVRKELSVEEGVLTSNDWRLLRASGTLAESQKLAERLTGAGIDGVIVPSMAVGAGPFERNLVLWKWNESAQTRIEVHDDEERLPLNAASWEAEDES